MYKILLILAIGTMLSACGIKPKVEVQTMPNPTTISQGDSVPLPSQEDIVRTFFGLINDKRIPEAVGMMTSQAVPDEAAKQAWGVMFNDFDSVEVVKIEKSTGENQFQVELAVKVNPRAANNPIPYYGYSDKTDTRFITLIKDNQGRWKIDGINTGP
jgi:hypothetical protein